jgi:hypothetical protein
MKNKKVVQKETLDFDFICCLENLGKDEFLIKHELMWRSIFWNPFDESEENYWTNQ